MNRLPAPQSPDGAPYRITYITAGAAGMYCGSCMHDNTLARALHQLGVDVQLIPLYTPIRTDEENVSIDRVFFGGINVYLQYKIPLFRYLPAFVDRIFDQPWLLRWATSRAMATSATQLGALTVAMLRGDNGPQRKEVRRLCNWLANHARADAIVLSNVLIGGCIPALKKRLRVPILVTLQGDDVFLNELPPPYREQAIREIQRLAPQIDAFVVYSQYYAEYMAETLGIPQAKIFQVPLGLDTTDFQRLQHQQATAAAPRPPRIGYLARLAPEKGLQVLVDAFLQLRQMPGTEQAELHVAGWLGKQHEAYVNQQFQKLRDHHLSDAVRHWGEVDRHQKIEFLSQLDVLSVPTIYHEPKGLFVLEALAAGVPVVQPDHGAFPELLQATGGGLLVRPGDPQHLAQTLHELLTDEPLRRRLGAEGQQAVHQRFNAHAMAHASLELYRQFIQKVAVEVSSK